MRTLRTHALIAEDGLLTARVPSDIPPGEHEVVLVIDELDARRAVPSAFPTLDLGPWPPGLSLRRADLYDDQGR